MRIALLISKVPLHSNGPTAYYAFIQLMINRIPMYFMRILSSFAPEVKSALQIYPHPAWEGLRNRPDLISEMIFELRQKLSYLKNKMNEEQENFEEV